MECNYVCPCCEMVMKQKHQINNEPHPERDFIICANCGQLSKDEDGVLIKITMEEIDHWINDDVMGFDNCMKIAGPITEAWIKRGKPKWTKVWNGLIDEIIKKPR